MHHQYLLAGWMHAWLMGGMTWSWPAAVRIDSAAWPPPADSQASNYAHLSSVICLAAALSYVRPAVVSRITSNRITLAAAACMQQQRRAAAALRGSSSRWKSVN